MLQFYVGGVILWHNISIKAPPHLLLRPETCNDDGGGGGDVGEEGGGGGEVGGYWLLCFEGTTEHSSSLKQKDVLSIVRRPHYGQ